MREGKGRGEGGGKIHSGNDGVGGGGLKTRVLFILLSAIILNSPLEILQEPP